jgi:hypothetical protein
LTESSLAKLEKHIADTGKPRHLHVFYTDRHPALGDLEDWIHAPKYGGSSGLDPIEEESIVETTGDSSPKK